MNPVLLWAHDGTTPAVGWTSKIWIDGDRLRAMVRLATSLTAAARQTITAERIDKETSIADCTLVRSSTSHT